MLITHQNPFNKSIMISVLGVPNAGKSSLINNLLGFDLSIVTNKPQTTRNRFHCVFTIDNTEIILIDNPGIHKSEQELNKRMNEQVMEGENGADLNLFLIDQTRNISKQIDEIKSVFRREFNKTWIVFTKSDLVIPGGSLNLEEEFEKAKEKLGNLERYFSISSETNENIHLLTGQICDTAVNAPHLYPDGDMSNKNERFFVAEYIRLQAFELLKDELPYEIAVTIEEYREYPNDEEMNAKISATILVNRPSQRAIVVGSKGSMIKEIGIRSRAKIEELIGFKTHLNLHVKVSPKWFKNNYILEEIGLPRAKNSTRVWRNKNGK